MICFIYGTTGELIKLAPVMSALEARGDAYLSLCSGQQVQQIPAMLGDFGLARPDLWLGRGNRGHDLKRPLDIPHWATRLAVRFARRRRDVVERMSEGALPLVIVHGDTFTTILGALMGRALQAPVAHVEAGMRSGSIRQPFPEEVNRRATAKLARIHYAPGRRAVGNLRREQVRGEVIDTGHNTIWDNLRLIPPGLPPGIDAPDEPFGLVSLHRFELIERPQALRAVMEELRGSSRRTRLLFVDHPTTAAAVARAGLDSLFDERFVRIRRLRYFHFLSLLKTSEFLVTDSGGSQEECAFLGHPCVVHRAVTEHDTGLNGGSVVLSGLDLKRMRDFLQSYHRWRRRPLLDGDSPTRQIVDHLESGGFLNPTRRDAHLRTRIPRR